MLRADEPAQFFTISVRPILETSCFKCHGGEKKIKGGLQLTSRQTILKGGDTGPAVDLKAPANSLLLKAINYASDDLQMPPKKKLPPEQIAILAKWVEMGLPWAGESKVAEVQNEPRHLPPVVNDEARRFWSFVPVQRPAIPNVKHPSWAHNALDRFILKRLEEKNLVPAPEADKIALIRRACYDLIGLPPTPEQVQAFVNDARPDAYEKLIDQLLASPHYGEKWARHWLDLVRYAETNSYERDGAKPNVWRYRDYVIRSLNADKPYDQFIKEQLAGDEMPDAAQNPDRLIATGYYRLGIWDDEPSDRLQAKYDALDDVVATTGQVFLGLTVDCARCHDHKIDPFPQADYYRLLAFFQNINHYHNGGPTDEAPIPGGKALCVTEPGTKVPDTFILMRGNANVPGAKVNPGFPAVLGGEDAAIPHPPKGAKSSGRRTILANWIASPKNPLTARVMANRIWQYHFGKGIVRSPSNYGYGGDRPTHPELLDFLASEFVQSGWSLKAMHRLIMTSSAYRMSSHANAEALKVDPQNDLLSHFDLHRLTAEEIRDSILSVNGTLNLKMFGPAICPPIPDEVLHGQSRPGDGWKVSPPDEACRRSVYIHIKRSLAVPMMDAFDSPQDDKSCPVRFVTTPPTQALGLLNSRFMQEEAGKFAARLARDGAGDRTREVALGLQLVSGRQPSQREVTRGLKLLDQLEQDGASPDLAMRDFCLMCLNLNEFVYVD